MKNIIGNIKEDEQDAFNLVCERTGKTPDQAKGVGYLNRLMKLCSITGLSITLDYDNNKFTVHNVPAIKKEEEVATPAETETEEVEEEDVVEEEEVEEPEEDDDETDPFG